MKNFCRKWCHNKSLGLLILRVVVGAIFLSHGWEKFGSMDGAGGTIAFFASLKLPAFWAYLVATVETVGGAMLILGIFTRYTSILLSIVSLFAMILVKIPFTLDSAKQAIEAGQAISASLKWKAIFRNSEIDLSLLASSLALVFMGGGRWSLTRWCRCGCHGKDEGYCMVCKVVGCADDKKKCCDNHSECKDGKCEINCENGKCEIDHMHHEHNHGHEHHEHTHEGDHGHQHSH